MTEKPKLKAEFSFVDFTEFSTDRGGYTPEWTFLVHEDRAECTRECLPHEPNEVVDIALAQQALEQHVGDLKSQLAEAEATLAALVALPVDDGWSDVARLLVKLGWTILNDEDSVCGTARGVTLTYEGDNTELYDPKNEVRCYPRCALEDLTPAFAKAKLDRVRRAVQDDY